MQQRYRTYSDFLSQFFAGKVQKLAVNAGFTCPNRDGTVGWGGCTYCNNQSFNPQYSADLRTVTAQLEAGKSFFAKKYPTMRYLAYFQAYTNTYADISKLSALYEEALSVGGVVGLVVGTRPDCVSNELLDYFAGLAQKTFVLLEYGVESTHNDTLRRINRGHDFACAERAIRQTSERGINTVAHLILGLPGESHEQIMQSATDVSALPVDVLKLHQLQLVKGTDMAREYLQNPAQFRLYDVEEYAELVADFLERLRPDIAVERFTSQSPSDLLIAPQWGLKNYEFVELVRRALERRNTWQGRLCNLNPL